MILNIDHIALAPGNLDEDIAILSKSGYIPVFTDRNLRNPEIKRRLMREYCQYQDICLLASAGNIKIELVGHRKAFPGLPYLMPVIEGQIPDDVKPTGEKRDLNGKNVEKCRWEHFGAFVWGMTPQTGGMTVNTLTVRTADIVRSIEFWNNFGFSARKDGAERGVLEFTSLLTKDRVVLCLIEEPGIREYHLDDRGFNCLAFVSNSVAREKRNLEKKEIWTSPIEEISVNGKKLAVMFSKGPCGEIVEVIGIQ